MSGAVGVALLSVALTATAAPDELPTATAVPDDRLTLGEAITKALSEGVEARIAHLEADRAGHAVGETRANYLPQVGLSSDAGWSNRYDETFTAQDQAGQWREYGLATLAADRAWLRFHVSQILLDLKQWREIEREQLAAEAALVTETRDRDEVAYEVTRRYARLVALERKASLDQEQIERARGLDVQAGHLFDAGRTLELDRQLVRLHVTDAELEARSHEQDIAMARADLWLAIGEAEPLRVPLEPDSLPTVDPYDAGYGAVEAVAQAPELRILELRRRMQEASVSAARAGRLPTMKFVSGYSHYGPKRYDAYEDEIWVGVDIQVPIFDGFRSGHAIAGAEREAEIARLRYQQALQQKRARVADLVRRLETGQQRLELAREREAASEEQVRLADLNLRAERGDVSSAVAANERQARFAQEVIDAEFGQVELWTALQRELGRLTFQVLGPIASAPTAAP
jgi:outer membrane protein